MAEGQSTGFMAHDDASPPESKPSAGAAQHLVWVLFLGLGVALIAGAATVPRGAVDALGILAIAIGLVWHRPNAQLGWLLIILGRATWVLADLAWTQLPAPSPWLALAFMLQYPLIAAGLVALAFPRGPARAGSPLPRRAGLADRLRTGLTLLDAAILTAGAAILVWMLLIEPYRLAVTASGPAGLASGMALGYAGLGLLVLFGLLCLLLSPRDRVGVGSGAAALLALGVGFLVAGDAAYYLLAASGPLAAVGAGVFAFAVPEQLWLCWAVLAGTAALHPAVRPAASVHDEPDGAPDTPARGRVLPRHAAPPAILPRGRLIGFIVLAVAGASVAVAFTPPLTALAASMIMTVMALLLVARLGLVANVADRLGQSLEHAQRERKALGRQLRACAATDPLTGLANRTMLGEHLERVLEGPQRERTRMLLLDIDGFAEINGTLGHAGADALLVEVGQRLRAALPAVDLLARLGGDEFAAIWRTTDTDSGDIADAASEQAEPDPPALALACLREPVRIGLREVQLTGGVGVLPLGEHRGASAVLRDADLALRAAKHAGRDRIAHFDPALRAAQDQRSELTAGLRRALANDELTLHYQPVVRLNDGEITAVEALLRWRAPSGLIPPNTFIPVAEETGLIVPIGGWVLRQACQQARDWYESHRICVTVNISGLQLHQPDFVDEVLSVLEATGLPGTALVLELTETTLITNTAAAEQLNRLRERGVRVAVDDFGTGYSSLSYLVQLPVDVLKIDRAFTAREHHRSLTRAILDLAGSLELETIAEGVETGEQAETLRGLGCPYGQGFLFSRPVEPAAIDELLAAQRSLLPTG